MKNPKEITISVIAALGNQRQIGKNNKLLWSIPADLERFKKLTSGKAVIMGRKTWESLPKSVRPLPKRENIILTRQKDFTAHGAVVKNDPESALSYAKDWSQKNGERELFIIGGESIYRQYLSHTENLYLTLVDTDQKGDAFFPKYDDSFKIIKAEKQKKSHVNFTFLNLQKK